MDTFVKSGGEGILYDKDQCYMLDAADLMGDQDAGSTTSMVKHTVETEDLTADTASGRQVLKQKAIVSIEYARRTIIDAIAKFRAPIHLRYVNRNSGKAEDITIVGIEGYTLSYCQGQMFKKDELIFGKIFDLICEKKTELVWYEKTNSGYDPDLAKEAKLSDIQRSAKHKIPPVCIVEKVN